jgi:hypothetical protein
MNNYFCVLPFFSYEIDQDHGKNIYCCRLPVNQDINTVRNSIKNQQRNSACQTCWRLEDQGLISERQIHNRTYDVYADRDLELIEKDAINGKFGPRIVKLATSNLCNGTCVTCESSSSSAWARLERKPISYNIIDQSHIDSIDWAQVVQLSFVGGEPLLERRNFEILQKLVDLGNLNCFISIVTNGSCELTDAQLSLLQKFSNSNICVSIDGVSKSFEYIRYPLKWNTLTKNLIQFKRIARYVSVSCMVSNLNIFNYSQYVDFFKENNIDYTCKQIESPKYFVPGNLPDDFKKRVIDNNLNYQTDVAAFLNMGNYSDTLFQQFWNEVDRQDRLKNISIADYLPELAATRI